MSNYKKLYRKSYFKYWFRKFSFSKPKETYELVFVIQEESRGWILEAICKEIAAYYPGKHAYAYDVYNLPHSNAYFLAHYSFLPICLKSNPHIWGSKILAFHTHPSNIHVSQEEFIYASSFKSVKIVCMNSLFERQLKQEGIKEENITHVISGADKDIFRHHERGSGIAGFSTAFYERKNPDRILKIIKLLPHRKFILLGKNWEKYDKYEELISLKNLTYVQANYKEYPKYYEMMDVFVSPAILEGGPIPLIEAMMSNAVPVASKTGFAPDIIQDKKNGFLFNVDATGEEICELIEEAFLLKTNIRETVLHLTWQNFSKNIQNLL